MDWHCWWEIRIQGHKDATLVHYPVVQRSQQCGCSTWCPLVPSCHLCPSTHTHPPPWFSFDTQAQWLSYWGLPLPAIMKSHECPNLDCPWPLWYRCYKCPGPPDQDSCEVTHSRAPLQHKERPPSEGLGLSSHPCLISPPRPRPLFQLPVLFYRYAESTFFNASFDQEYWSWGLLLSIQTYSRQAPFSINKLCSLQQKLPKLLIWPISYVLFCFSVTTNFCLKWPCLEYLIFVTQPNINLLCKYYLWVITCSESGPIQFSEI